MKNNTQPENDNYNRIMAATYGTPAPANVGEKQASTFLKNFALVSCFFALVLTVLCFTPIGATITQQLGITDPPPPKHLMVTKCNLAGECTTEDMGPIK